MTNITFELPLCPAEPDATSSPETILPNGFTTQVSRPTLTVWPAPQSTKNPTGVLICPGGGYETLALDHEGAAVARWLNALGITAFVLKYRVPAPGPFAPLQDVFRAVRLVRGQANEFGLDSTRLGILGASAGGHLAACAGTLYSRPNAQIDAAVDAVSARPDFLILLYPVITFIDPCQHAGSKRALLGTAPDTALCELFSLERQVSANTPPTFLVHAADDIPVPVRHSLLFFEALQQNRVPSELHIYERGFHGFGLGPSDQPVGRWTKSCEVWLRSRAWI